MISKKAILALYLKKQSIKQQVYMLKFYENKNKQKNVHPTKNNLLESDNVIPTKNNLLESDSDPETSEEY